MVLVLLSCTSMQGIKFYLKWGKKKFEITKKVVEETKKFKDLFENFGDLDKENDDYNKVFDKDGNFIFNMKDIAEKIKLPNGDKLVDEMARNDVKNLAKLLGNPEGSFMRRQDHVVLDNLLFYLNNKKALKVCYKDFQDRMTDKELLVFLEGKSGFLSYVIGENVIPNDFFMGVWRRYAKENLHRLKKPYFKKIEISDKFLFLYNKINIVEWNKESSEVRCIIQYEDMFGVGKTYKELSLPVLYTGDDIKDIDTKKISEKKYNEDLSKLQEKCSKISGVVKGRVACSPTQRYFISFKGNILKLHSFDQVKTFLANYKTEKDIEAVSISPNGTKLVLIEELKSFNDHFHRLRSRLIHLNVEKDDFLYKNDFAENVVVRGLRLYKEKNKKPFVYYPYSKRIKLLSKEMVEQLLEVKLLRKSNREEIRKRKERKKKKGREVF